MYIASFSLLFLYHTADPIFPFIVSVVAEFVYSDCLGYIVAKIKREIRPN